MHCIELPYASHLFYFILKKRHTQACKLGGELTICPMTIGQGSNA